VALVAGFYLARFTRHTENGSVIGFPIPWGGFERSPINGRRMDFVSPISPILWTLDLIFWLGMGHVPVCFSLLLKRRRPRNVERYGDGAG
jgi:hypothetical protein